MIDPRKNHISYVSSVMVYSMSAIFCVATLFGLKVGWDSMPPTAHTIWGMIVFYAVSAQIVFVFTCIAAMFAIKLHAQWKLDHDGIGFKPRLPRARKTD